MTSRPMSSGKVKSKHGSDPNIDPGNPLQTSGSPVPIPHTPSNLLPYAKTTQQDRFDDSGPHKSDMMARMEQLNRGDRVRPPCDRCRRLHMDCLKNLTACMGCTKKHAKCSWKDVTDQELVDNPLVLRSAREEMDVSSGGERDRSRDPYRDLPTISHQNPPRREPLREEDRGVRDEELLGEEASGDEDLPHTHQGEVVTSTTDHSMPAHLAARRAADGLEEPRAIPSPHALPSPPREYDNHETTIFTTGSNAGSRPKSTNGFQSVNVKGVVVGYDPGTQYEEESTHRTASPVDKERDALIQLSAAAQQVSEYQQQQQQEHQRSPSREQEEGQYAQAQQASDV